VTTEYASLDVTASADFLLTPEHRELRRTLRSFFAKEAPTAVVARNDREETFPQETYDKMAALDLCGIAISPEYGGSGADELTICIVAEEIARVSAALTYAFIPTVTFCARGIDLYGSEEQKRALLPEIAAGRMRVAMGLTEPEAGSDLTHLSTRATRDGDEWVISGQKVFTTGADSSDYIFTFVRTDREASAGSGLSVILVPRESDGVTVRPLPKLAGQATHTCEVFLDDVRVPVENLVGDLGAGTKIIFRLLDGERTYVGAQGVGIAQGALDMALKFAQERRQFGKAIVDHQAVGHMLADMAMDVHHARLVTYHAAWKLGQGIPCTLEASIAKTIGSEAGTRCAARGMQVLGGYSYMVEYGMERYYRESKLYEIAGGTNQIQRNLIVKHLQATGLPDL
jgi:alkylation response protein AidB-like acyl-CoA dehydrogenase